VTRGWAKRLLGEPLVQFFALGAALFGLHALVGRPDDTGSSRIVVTPGQIDHLATTFARTWQRPPSGRELQGLIDDYVREEVYAREAAGLGLDRDDTVIRRRLRQKMEFVTEETAAPPAPTDDDLRAWLAAHPEPYRLEPRLAFRQVLVSRDRRGDAAEADARALLERLTAAGPDGALDVAGDSMLLPRDVPLASRGEIARQFGEGFAAALAERETGKWVGPIESGYGLHLVFVRQREEGRTPGLDEVRDRVARDWTSARRQEAMEAAYRRLRDRYTVVVERDGAAP
jgi:hypothetical protein